MIEYVIGENPDDRILLKASKVLSEGGLIVFPTDTNWIIACDPFVKKGLEKFYRIKKEGPLKHYSILCDSISRASEVAHVSDKAFRMIRGKIPGHYTFIFTANKKITRAVQASKTDKEVGVRFVPSHLVTKLIEVHNGVVLSTNITPEMLGLTENDDVFSYQIEEELVGHIDLILDPGEYHFVGQSTVVDLSDELDIHLVREGAGDWP